MLEKALLLGIIALAIFSAAELAEVYHPISLAGELVDSATSECRSAWSAEACQSR